MAAWKCVRCGQPNGTGYNLCWNCGTGADGSPPTPDFVRVDVPTVQQLPRELSCLRCAQAMSSLGLRRFHEGSQAAPFLLGNLGELLVDREGFELLACNGCGKVEFFLPPGKLQRSKL